MHLYTSTPIIIIQYVYCIVESHVSLLGHIYPWTKCVFTRTYVLGPYVYLPGPMSWDHMCTYQKIGPWVIRMSLGLMYTYQDLRRTYLDHTRTCVLGPYVYLPGHGIHARTLADWKKEQQTQTNQRTEET